MRIDSLPLHSLLFVSPVTGEERNGEGIGENSRAPVGFPASEALYVTLKELKMLWQELDRQCVVPAYRHVLRAVLADMLPDVAAIADGLLQLMQRQKQGLGMLRTLADDLRLAQWIKNCDQQDYSSLVRALATLWTPEAARSEWTRLVVPPPGAGKAFADDKGTPPAPWPETGTVWARLSDNQSAQLRAVVAQFREQLLPPEVWSQPAEQEQRDYLALVKLACLAPWLSWPNETIHTLERHLRRLADVFFRLQQEQAGPNVWQAVFLLRFPGQNHVAYPVYLQLYPNDRRAGGLRAPQHDIWLRLFLYTDNLGAVDLLFRLIGRKAAVSAIFRQEDYVRLFDQYKGELAQALVSLPLTVMEIQARVGRGVGNYEVWG